MGSVVPSPEDMVCVIPAQVILLGEALAPVAHGARQALTRTVPSSGQAFDPLEDTSRHLSVIQQALNRPKPILDALMTDVIHKMGASAIDAGRAAGRLEQMLSEFVDCYLDAKESPADREAGEARPDPGCLSPPHYRNLRMTGGIGGRHQPPSHSPSQAQHPNP